MSTKPEQHHSHPVNHNYDHNASPVSASSAPVSAGPSRQHSAAQYIEPGPKVRGKGKSVSRERGTSSLGGQSVEPEDPNRPKDRHEPRGRKPNDQLPPSRAREVQRAFRLRRAEHLAALEERINLLEAENSQLRALLSLPEAERERIGSGPTGRGKSLKEGGVPMSERVRARKEARARERRLLGLPEPVDGDSSHEEDDEESTGTPGQPSHKRLRQTSTMSPRASGGTGNVTPGLPSLAMPGATGTSSRSGLSHGVHGSGDGNGNSALIGTNHHTAVQQFQIPSLPSDPSSSSSNTNTFGIPNFSVGDMGGFNMTLPSADNPFGDFESAIFKSHSHSHHGQQQQQQHQNDHQASGSGSSPSFAAMFGLYDEGTANHHHGSASISSPHGQNGNGNSTLGQTAPQYSRNVSNTGSALGRSPISPPATASGSGSGSGPGGGSGGGVGVGIGVGAGNSNGGPGTSPSASTSGSTNNNANQPDLLVRLRQCCHLSDSHVVNDPGLLIFATRLCQSFPCQFSGAHAEGGVAISDSEHLLLDDSWKLLRNQLDPGTELDGEHRINTGRMAAELVIRAAHSRGSGGWIVCRYSQGMSVKRALVAGLIQGLGGHFE